SWSPTRPFEEPDEPPAQLTWMDAMAIMQRAPAFRQTASARVQVAVQSENPDVRPFQVIGRATFADFFAMFDLPFLYGGGWDRAADRSREQVVVITREVNDRVFGGENSVGETIALSGHIFRVVGVLDEWNPIPKFYDLTSGAINDSEDLFIPFNLITELELSRAGNTNCWKPVEGDGMEAFLNSECVWIQMWAELRNEDERQAYHRFLDSYVESQKSLGRFSRPMNNRLDNVTEWMENQEVVQAEARMMAAVGIMFLAVCLLNTIGLLLSKFIGKAGEIGVRRAIGASKRTVFIQFLVESACIGTLGGLLGLVCAWLGLEGINWLFDHNIPMLFTMDWVMVGTAMVIALLASLLAGMYPAWQACNVEPAQQLKSQ
ncbi:MAG: FtsX-like permease family protein, partial [Pseudomonadales bacterium]|nr:FtsX-like permease family protein [Pseudomonadales bacterium]